MNKRNLIVWSLYDFANSIVMIVFFLYYSQWLVVEQNVSDFWFNMTFTISGLFLLFSAPILGSIIDKTKAKLPGLRLMTTLAAIFYAATGLIVIQATPHIIWSMVTFAIAVFFYLLSFNFYNPLISDIAPQGRQGIVSGWGLFANYLGQIAGILIGLLIISGKLVLWGEPGRAQTLIPATVIFFAFSLPMLILFREKSTYQKVAIKIGDEYKNAFRSFLDLCKRYHLGYFFLAYFFFNDAVITASNNFPLYLERVFTVSDTVKSYILLGILVTSVIGSPISGWLADRFGTKKTLLGVLLCWMVLFPLMALTTNFPFFIFLSVLMGLWFGAVWTVTRAFLARNVPYEKINLSFSYYTILERFATFIGPISWGLIIAFAPDRNALNYRLAAFAMGIFVFIGYLLARKIPESQSPLTS